MIFRNKYLKFIEYKLYTQSPNLSLDIPIHKHKDKTNIINQKRKNKPKNAGVAEE